MYMLSIAHCVRPPWRLSSRGIRSPPRRLPARSAISASSDRICRSCCTRRWRGREPGYRAKRGRKVFSLSDLYERSRAFRRPASRGCRLYFFLPGRGLSSPEGEYSCGGTACTAPGRYRDVHKSWLQKTPRSMRKEGREPVRPPERLPSTRGRQNHL